MQFVVTAVPLLVLAAIVALIVASALRGRVAWTPRARTPRPRTPRPVKSTLRDVSRDQMDKDLNDLIRRS
jgi:hypothetical protein